MQARPRTAERPISEDFAFTGGFGNSLLTLMQRFSLSQPVLIATFLFVNICCQTEQRANAKHKEIFRGVFALGGLNIREKPARDSAKLGWAADNEFVQILQYSDAITEVDGISGKWAKVSYNSIEGWVFEPFLAAQEIDKNCIQTKSYESAQYKAPNWSLKILCGSNDDDLLLNASWYYRKWWRDSEGNYLEQPDRKRQREIIKNIRADLKIQERRENVALLKRTSTALDYGTFTENADIWILKDNYWQFYEGVYGWGKSFLTDLNNDELPDVITEYGCCGNTRVKIFVGEPTNVLKTVFDQHFSEIGEYELIVKKCEAFRLRGRLTKPEVNAEFRFDCAKNIVFRSK